MIKDISEKPVSKLEIDLTSPDGNSFALMGIAKNLAKQLNADWEFIKNEMTSGDYEHLIEVFDTFFGDHVILYR